MNVAVFDLNLLRVFDALIKYRNVTRAGAAIGLSQPAMSNALSRLRKAFADPLFIRGRGTMTPTSRAQRAHAEIRRALENIENALAGAEFLPAYSGRTFTMAVSENAAFYILPLLLRRLRRDAPNVELRVLSTARIPGFELVADGSVDLSIGLVSAQLPKDIASRLLFREETVCIARRGHPAFLPRLTVKKFLAYPHITAQPNVTTSNPVDTMLEKLGYARKVIVGVPHFLMIPFLISGTECLATIGGRFARHFASLCQLEVRDLPFALAPNDASLAWHRRFDRDAGHRWLREVIAAECLGIK